MNFQRRATVFAVSARCFVRCRLLVAAGRARGSASRAAPGAAQPTFTQGRGADALQALHDLSPAGRDRADVAADLPRGAALGPRHSRQRRQRHDAAVARRSGARQVGQRPPPDRREKDTIVRWVDRRCAAGRREGPAAGARLRAGLDHRPARRRRHDGQGVHGSGAGRDSLSVLRGADQLHRGQVDPGARGSAAATARSCTTCWSTRAPRR